MTDPSAAPSLARSSPAALRNRAPILDALRRVLPPHGTVLEIGSGTGEHITFFAAAFPGLTWQPSDPDGSAIDSINAHAARRNLPNLRMPVRLDAAGDDWPHAQFDAILASNVVHIAPWAVTEGLMAGAARGLSVGGLRAEHQAAQGPSHHWTGRTAVSRVRCGASGRTG